MRSYSETLDYLFSKLPLFQNVGKAAYKKDLDNTIRLLNYIGNPHLNQKWIHIGGTNGKGSTSSMIASVLTANGYKTGLYTSPHLVDFRERIRIDGQWISEQFIIDFTHRIEPIIDEIQPSFFEITVAMAFEYFAQQKIDVGVIEVGLGGKLDSTNVITPIISAITSIGFDHMDILGDTLEKIGLEKAGIIKPQIPFVLGDMPSEATSVIENYGEFVEGQKLPLLEAPTGWKNSCSLRGNYQSHNIKVAYTVINYIGQNGFNLNELVTVEALANVHQFSGLRGRWDKVIDSPTLICDTGHNEDGVRSIINQLQSLLSINSKLFMVWGMVKDKDIQKIIALLPKDARYFSVKPSVIRGMDSQVMFQQLTSIGLSCKDSGTVQQGILDALKEASPNDVIFVGGSTFVVGDFYAYWDQR